MISIIMLPNLTRIGILIDVKINQDFISKVFCIDRDQPVNNCGGQCYLAEKLRKAEETEEKRAPVNQTESIEAVYYVSKSAFAFFAIRKELDKKLNTSKQDQPYTSSFIADIFHPPESLLI